MKYSKKGFTLIELLVVIAIIALLLSILIPALTKVKVQAQFVICGSNIRQVGVAEVMHTTENDGYFSDALESFCLQDPAYTSWRCRWHDEEMSNTNRPDLAGQLWPYLENQDVVMCPAFRSLSRQEGARHPTHNPSIPISPQYAFSQNAFIGPLDQYVPALAPSGSSPAYTWTTPYITPKISQIRRASEIFMFTEENMWTIEAPKYAFTWSVDVLNDNGLFPWHTGGPGSVCDSAGSFHKTSWATEDKRNEGVANAVFADGHTGTMYPWETMKLGSAKQKMADLPH